MRVLKGGALWRNMVGETTWDNRDEAADVRVLKDRALWRGRRARPQGPRALAQHGGSTR